MFLFVENIFQVIGLKIKIPISTSHTFEYKVAILRIEKLGVIFYNDM